MGLALWYSDFENIKILNPEIRDSIQDATKRLETLAKATEQKKERSLMLVPNQCVRALSYVWIVLLVGSAIDFFLSNQEVFLIRQRHYDVYVCIILGFYIGAFGFLFINSFSFFVLLLHQYSNYRWTPMDIVFFALGTCFALIVSVLLLIAVFFFVKVLDCGSTGLV